MGDPQRASQYAADVFACLLEREKRFLPCPEYLDTQPHITGKMRAILIDWLVDVHMKYRMRLATLYLTVNIIDRYLSRCQVARKKLQLVGVVAMSIAGKYEEIDPPKIWEFAYITDHTYSNQEIVNMECTMLQALDYEVAAPTPASILDRLQRLNGCDAVHLSHAQYILELSLINHGMLQYPPSLLVCAALLLSNELLGRSPVWSAAMAHHTQRSLQSLQDCKEHLMKLQIAAKTATLQAVRRKYQLDMYHKVTDWVDVNCDL